MRWHCSLPGVLAAVCLAVFAVPAMPQAGANDEGYLAWTEKQAESIGAGVYQRGRVGGFFDVRMLKTERAYNYKLAATWLTPEAIRATARLLQLRSRLSDDETRALVAEAESASGTAVMIEIDPREGSGVIPNDWDALLQPKGRPGHVVRGTISPQLRRVQALAGGRRRNYDYDRFWVTFPLQLQDGAPLFSSVDQVVELIVRIVGQEGRVEWPIPDSVRSTLK